MITLTNRHISCVLSALSLAVAIVDIFISVFHKSISTIYDHDKFGLVVVLCSKQCDNDNLLVTTETFDRHII